VAEKKVLALEELEYQTALELPERETPATAVISCLAVCVGHIDIRNINVAAANNICANVTVVAAALTNVLSLAGLTNQTVLMDCRVTGNVNQG